jgi:hypothetical protein
MSEEAEEFFKKKTIENATRPRMKKFLALVDREAEGKILEDYHNEKQRELLIEYEKYHFGLDYEKALKGIDEFLTTKNQNK